MRNEFKKLIEAAKDYKEYQSIGNGAKLNCAIEAAELALQQPLVSGSLPTDEEIEKQAELKFPVKTHKTPDLSPNVLKKVIFINACKWMRKNWQ